MFARTLISRDIPKIQKLKRIKIHLKFQIRNFVWMIFDRGSHELIGNLSIDLIELIIQDMATWIYNTGNLARETVVAFFGMLDCVNSAVKPYKN